MEYEQLLQLEIDRAVTGHAAMRATYRTPTGLTNVETTRGAESAICDLATRLANANDLVPLWRDGSWLRSGRERPPVALYGPRRANVASATQR